MTNEQFERICALLEDSAEIEAHEAFIALHKKVKELEVLNLGYAQNIERIEKINKTLVDRIKELEAQLPKWVSVKDRLPSRTCDCFEYFPEHDFVLLGQWLELHGCFSGDLRPSHWAQVRLPTATS